MNMKIGTLVLAMGLVLPSLSVAKPLNNQALSYYCGNDKIEYEKSITVGKGTRVHLNEGPFYQVEQVGEYQPTLDFINQQIVSAGVSETCAEFLLTNGFLQSMDSGQMIARVYFDFDNAQLTDKSKYVLDTITQLLKLNNNNLVVEGHADTTGTADYNFSLGLKRSRSVAHYLKQLGVDKGRLESTSVGDTMSISDNDTEAGRQLNRRVEIK